MKSKQKIIYAVLGFMIGNALLLLLFVGYSQLNNSAENAEEIKFQRAMQLIVSGDIKKVNIKSNAVEITHESGKLFQANIDKSDSPRDAILSAANENGVREVNIEPTSKGLHWLIILNLFPYVILLAILCLLIGIFIRLKNNNSIK